MFNPFTRISQRVQHDHKIYGNDVKNVHVLQKRNIPLLNSYCLILQKHKSECPLCTCPRWYAFCRKVARAFQCFVGWLRTPIIRKY